MSASKKRIVHGRGMITKEYLTDLHDWPDGAFLVDARVEDGNLVYEWRALTKRMEKWKAEPETPQERTR